MKQYYSIILSLIFFNCLGQKTNQNINSNSIKKQVELFEFELKSNIIKPTFSTITDSVSFFDSKLKIKTIKNKNHFQIKINGNKIETDKYLTLNDVWNKKDSINYANQISQVKYYKPLNLLILQLDFYPCTGLGCAVNYQLIYDLSSKKTYPFGRFRTGFDMNLYKFKNDIYYLSKSFYGRNAQLKDTIIYNLYKIKPKSIPQRDEKYFAKFTYEDENYENETSFTRKWIQ
ncbi:hypothetical protein GCM10008015_29760 [Flavobacterium palustre]|uniref:Uncharacterized protein n=1 Tax=Flavobacterium palustre TaxID=1476463 RepID=A0ABQ1HSL0_9FLAO|nr:hypothetical protein [Flavobacterium palustre]GGA87154.1 hypothetical protein GCM10008015_29760 [Flavobacterium palustre]